MDIEKIVMTFCEARGVKYSEIHSTQSNASLYYTRYMIWHYLHYNCKMSAGQISRTFGRNRPSIFRGIRILRHQMRYNNNLREEYNTIVKKAENGD